MKKLLLPGSILILLIVSDSCWRFRSIRGNGDIETDQRSLSDFDGIRVAGPMDVYLAQGAFQPVRIECEENLLRYLETDVDGGTLKVRFRDGIMVRPTHKVKIYVTAPEIESLKIAGSGDILSESSFSNNRKMELEIAGAGNIKLNEVDAPEVSGKISGSGNITVAGQTKDVDINIVGSGDIKFSDLKAETAKVRIAGSGNANVYASIDLSVNIVGSGDVYYGGNPNVRTHTTGSGRVRKRD